MWRAKVQRIALLVLITGGCSSSTEPGEGGIEGTIVARDLAISIGAPPTIHVKEAPSEECGVVFLVRPSTRIKYQGVPISSSLADDLLTVGADVRVTARYVLESCPGQSSAIEIDIRAPR